VSASVTGIISFGLTTRNLQRLAVFYEHLGFTVGPHERVPEEEVGLLGLTGGGTRLTLRLGNASVTLDCFDEPGREYPADASAADLCFQHFALVTSDAAAAWGRALRSGATAISPHGPVTLPPEAGAVTAGKFRDPDGHPLEFLQFPPGARNHWHGDGMLGIDHSAISVSDADTSERFYGALGLSVGGPTLNRGDTQAALDGLDSPLVQVVPMRPPQAPPHLELLAYRVPPSRPAGAIRANDLAGTRTVWASDRDAIVTDPDGHLHVLRKRR
jgi:catechol 2,3-dioxygenase-like lactoylglutathione lyase family enzyme